MVFAADDDVTTAAAAFCASLNCCNSLHSPPTPLIAALRGCLDEKLDVLSRNFAVEPDPGPPVTGLLLDWPPVKQVLIKIIKKPIDNLEIGYRP